MFVDGDDGNQEAVLAEMLMTAGDSLFDFCQKAESTPGRDGRLRGRAGGRGLR